MNELIAFAEASTFGIGLFAFFWFGIPAYTWYIKRKHKSQNEFIGPDYF